MNRIPFLSSAALVLAVLAGPAPALAQTEVVAQPNPDADLLAAEMRNLAVNPRDLRALLSAAEISTRLDDTSAALAFFARAGAGGGVRGRPAGGGGAGGRAVVAGRCGGRRGWAGPTRRRGAGCRWTIISP